MEMATILHSSLANLPFHTPLFHSKFLHSFPTIIHHRSSLPSRCLTISPPPPRKSLSTNCSFSDDTTSKAAGGESAAISLKESDERGFRESETEVLKQLSSMGRLVVCAGDGAVQDSTNLALLRHGISIWIDMPLDMLAKGIIENKTQLLSSEIAISGSYSEVLSQLTALYEDMRKGYATATISIQKVAYQLGYEDMDAVSTEDITMEVLKEIERLTRVKKMMEAAARPF